MKKFALMVALLLVLSFSVFAEGEYPAGGKGCPQGQQTCLTDGTPHTGGKSDNTIYKEIFDFLKSIFG